MLLPFMGLSCYKESEEEKVDETARNTPVLTDRPDMTLAVYRGRKAIKQTKHYPFISLLEKQFMEAIKL